MGIRNMRIGQGYDVHQLVEGRKLIIGGVDIPYEKGLLGHSDADVLLHAISDALLGAAALGDIGRHFSDTDAKYKNIDSRILLREVAAPGARAGFSRRQCGCDHHRAGAEDGAAYPADGGEHRRRPARGEKRRQREGDHHRKARALPGAARASRRRRSFCCWPTEKELQMSTKNTKGTNKYYRTNGLGGFPIEYTGLVCSMQFRLSRNAAYLFVSFVDPLIF